MPLFSLLLALAPAIAQASTTPSAEIHVSLFGQPCILQGAADERTLRAIHSLSPEQLYPQRDSPLTSAPTRRALEKLRTITGAPAALDRYREKLTKRLNAQLSLLEALESFRKSHKPDTIVATAKNLPPARQKDFEAAVRKAEMAKTLAHPDTQETLFDVYSDAIEPDPEEEFHRTIQRLNVQYACSFEEGGGAAGDTDAE